jgi:hypothetical protein
MKFDFCSLPPRNILSLCRAGDKLHQILIAFTSLNMKKPPITNDTANRLDLFSQRTSAWLNIDGGTLSAKRVACP